MKIGIIGYGYVGRAIAAAHEDSEILINDPLVEDSSSLTELKAACSVIYVCVPTPEHADGSCDASILICVLDKLQGYKGLVISKSTALPQIYADLETRYSDLNLAHVPEFLTAKNAVMDYQYPVKVVIGCKQALRQEVFSTIITNKINFDMTTVQFCSIAEAAMFKYLANTMLAMKVVINNEYYDMCNAMGISWDNVAKIAATDPRLGDTHWAVPGPDGARGFGGGCFPKDLAALLSLAKFLNTDPSMLEAAAAKNKKLRN